MKKLIAGILMLIVITSTVRSLGTTMFGEPSTMIEKEKFRGTMIEYLWYCYWTPVVKETCEYGLDGSCDRHDSRSECTSRWDDMTVTERGALAGTLGLNALLLIGALLLWRSHSKSS